MIDNGNLSSNGGGVTQLGVPSATPLDAPAALGASPETLLFRAELLSPDQLGELVQERVVSGRSVEEIVVERGWLDAHTVASVLGGAPADPAPEPHPDPFALPAVPPADPFPVASFAPAPEPQHPVVLETPPAPFAPVPQSVAADVDPAPVLLEPVVLEPVALEPVALEPVALEPVAHSSTTGVEFRVSIRFVGNDCVELAAYADAAEAKSAARELVVQLSSERGDWPFVGGRFVRPDAVLSVDVDAVVR